MVRTSLRFLLLALVSAPLFAEDVSDELRAGYLVDWPPYYVVGEDGEPSGFAVDVLNAVAEREGVSIRYRPFPDYRAMNSALSRGEIDVVPSAGVVSGRDFLFTSTVSTFRVSLFVRKSSAHIRSLDDIGNSKIGVVQQNIGEQLVREFDDVDVIVHHDVAEALLKLLAGDIDGLIYPAPVLLDLAKRAEVDHQLREILPPLAEVKRAIMVNKNNPELWKRLDRAVGEFVATPAFEEIYARWHQPDAPWLNVRRVIVIGGSILAGIVALLIGWRYVSVESLNRQLRFRARLLDVIDEAVIAVDAEGNITYWNRFAEELYGWSAEEVLGQSIFAMIPEGISDADVDTIWQELQRGESRTEEFLLQDRQGRRFPGLVTIAPMFANGGKVDGLVSVSRDISEHRQLEQQLRQAQKMEAIGRLAGGVAHDFNNLLTVIKGHTELALESVEPHSVTSTDLEEVSHTADRATTLVRQLLTFSRRQSLEPEVVDVAELIDGFRAMLDRILRENIELVVDVAPGLWPVKVDRGQLEQVLMNLAVNGGDAMPSGGRLKISARNVATESSEECVQINMSDTGVGIAADIQEKVFEPFFTTREKTGGTGLGLAVVHGIITQSGGTIDLDSEVGKGTTFTIHLPRTAESEANGEETLATETVADRGDALIMVVEDERAVRNLVSRMLSSEGYNVIAVDNPATALNDKRVHEIELLISDVVMPGMNGPELARRIQEVRPSLPVLFITGYARDEPIALNGPYGILPKPFSQQELSGRVREILSKVAT